jgi:hypothetical protein
VFGDELDELNRRLEVLIRQAASELRMPYASAMLPEEKMGQRIIL